MRRLFQGLILLAAIAPSPARAESRDGTFVEKRTRVRNEPRKAKSAAVIDKSKLRALPEVSPPRKSSGRPDVCALAQRDSRGVTMRTHLIERGDSLSVIAWRHGTSVKALAAANGLTENQTIRTGQKLVIPQHSRLGGGDDWLKYTSVPKQRGRLELMTYKTRFRGQVVESGRVLPGARQAVSELLGATGSHPPISERLLRLLVRVSDTFGGRSIRVVSGFRSSSYFADSRHKTSEAIDFSILGVPNDVVRQYLLLLDDVGVGYYPNSSFLHLDVRGCSMQWVDYAGPGEAPRRSPRQSTRNVIAQAIKATEAPRAVDAVTQASRAVDKRTEASRSSAVDDVAEEVVAAMEEAAKTPAPSGEEQAPAPSSKDRKGAIEQGERRPLRVVADGEPSTAR